MWPGSALCSIIDRKIFSNKLKHGFVNASASIKTSANVETYSLFLEYIVAIWTIKPKILKPKHVIVQDARFEALLVI